MLNRIKELTATLKYLYLVLKEKKKKIFCVLYDSCGYRDGEYLFD